MKLKKIAMFAFLLMGAICAECQQDDSTLIVSTNWIQPSRQFRYYQGNLCNIYSPPFQSVVMPDDTARYRAAIPNGPASDVSEHTITMEVNGGHEISKSQRMNMTWTYTFNNFPFIRSDWGLKLFKNGGGSEMQPFTRSGLNPQAVLIKENLQYTGDGSLITRVARVYDCGKPMTVPIQIVTTNTLGQLKKIAQQKAEKVSDKKNRVLKFYQDAADKGDPSALFRLGELFRDGDGVEKNLEKARDYFSKAAEAGSPSASEALKRLPQN